MEKADLRAAIYARYSTDRQKEASIEDQVRICRAHAERQGWRVTECYADREESGASLMRPTVQRLIQDALARRFDIILCEDLDRLSRDQEDIAGLYKRCQFAEVGIFTLADGEVSDLHVGIKGTIAARYLKDLAAKTHRGLEGRVLKGKSGGGLTYGYDVVHRLDEDGEPIRGDRVINEEQARIVRRIFEAYSAGQSPTSIAIKLNKEGIPGPSGAGWGPSTIHGNRRRGTGVINNELYIGRLVWNRLRYVRDPDSRKRVSRLNPEDEWIITDVPELRIVDDETWAKVKARQKALDERGEAFWTKQRPKYLLSQLLKCGCCGGGFSLMGKVQLGCANARKKGTCSNRLTISRLILERTVLDALQRHLMNDVLCAEFCAEYTRTMNRLRMEHSASRRSYEQELGQLERRRQKLVKSIMDGVPGQVLKDEATRILARKTELEQLLSTKEEPPPVFHPTMAARYRREIRLLIETFSREESRAEAAGLLRALIQRIVLTPDDAGDRLVIDLVGDLAGILSMAAGREKSAITKDLTPVQDMMVAGAGHSLGLNPGKEEGRPVSRAAAPAWQDKMVAGIGFEPMTFRL